MSRRRKLFILAALLLAILLLALWWLMRSPAPAPVAQPVVTPSEQGAPIQPGSPAAQTPQVAERVQASGAETVAKVFAERYGSFSSEAAFGNLRDVMALATPAYAAQLQAQADAGVAPTEYYGVTTRVIALTAEEMDEAAGTARFLVNAQRQEAKGSAQNLSVRYQAIEVSLEKSGDAWLVSGAAWQ